MDSNTFPTKGNLMLAKNSLALARTGYSLMDKKRTILVSEIMELIDKASGIQSEIDLSFRKAYAALQKANIDNGISRVRTISYTIPLDDSVRIKTRSVMGVEIPLVEIDPPGSVPTYAFYATRESIEEARIEFTKVKELTARLSMIENSAYRLAVAIKKAQKRANALRNITIPYYTQLVKDISDALEEKDREEFSRLKVIKSQHG